MERKVNNHERFRHKRSRSLEPGEIDTVSQSGVRVKTARYKHKQSQENILAHYTFTNKQDIKSAINTSTMGKTSFKPAKPDKVRKSAAIRGVKGIPDGTSIETSNQYAMLTDNDGADETIVNRRTTTSGSRKSSRIPPIIIPPPTTKTQIISGFTKYGMIDYRIKITSIGVYVFVDTAAEHSKMRSLLRDEKVPHYSHELPDDKAVKVVLKRLDKMDVQDLKKDLKEQGFEPNDIKLIVPYRPQYPNHVNYLLYYTKDKIDLKALYAVKAINHTIVSWEPFRPPKTPVTQCRNCYLFGHGTKHCGMPARCKFCSESHESSSCTPLKEAYDESMEKMEETAEPKIIDGFTPKCCNCGQPHIATDPTCSERKKYIDLQHRLADRNRAMHPKKTSTQPLVSKKEAPAGRWNNTTNSRLTTGLSFADAVAGHHNSHPPGFQAASNNTAATAANRGTSQGQHAECSNNLFSFDEINSLLNELLSGLSSCRDKTEQFKLISNLAIKYIYNGSK